MTNTAITSLINQINELLYQVKRCEEYYNAFLVLRNASLGGYNYEICVARDFFTITWQSLVDSCIVELIKIYEKSNAISVWKTINQCSDSPDVIHLLELNNPEKAQNIKKETDRMKCFLERETIKRAVKNLRTRRDKHYMHNDTVFFMDESKLASEEYLFQFPDVEVLIKGAESYLNSIYSILTDQAWKPEIHQKCLERERHPEDLTRLLELCKHQGKNTSV